MTSKEFPIWLQGFLDGNDTINEEGIQYLKNKIKEIVDYVDIPPIPYYPPVNIPYVQVGDCPAGGFHEYPENWLCTLPPFCKKCGYQAPQQIITYCDGPSAVVITEIQDYRDGSTTQVNYKIPVDENGLFSFKVSTDGVITGYNDNIVGPMCEVNPNRPCAVNTCCKNGPIQVVDPTYKIEPGMSYIDFEFPRTKMNWEMQVTSDPWQAGCGIDNCCRSGDSYIGKSFPDVEPKPWPKEVIEIKLDGSEWCEDSQKYIEFEVKLTDEDRAIIGTDKRYARFKVPIKPVPEELKIPGSGEYMFDLKTKDGQESYKELMNRKLNEATQLLYERKVRELEGDFGVPVKPYR